MWVCKMLQNSSVGVFARIISTHSQHSDVEHSPHKEQHHFVQQYLENSIMYKRQAAAGSPLPISEHQHIIKEAIDFGRRLQQANHGGDAHHMGGAAQEVHHTVGGCAVQPSADLIHQHNALQDRCDD